MNKHYEGMLLGKGLKFGLVISRFNEFITKRLFEGAQDALVRHDVNEGDVETAWVPGTFEIPLIAKKLAQTKKYDAIICLGAVIRGDTPHFEYIASEVAKGIARVTLDTGLPILYGIVTIVAVVIARPVIKRRPGGSDYVLMDVIGWIAVIINTGVIVKMVVAAKINSSAWRAGIIKTG